MTMKTYLGDNHLPLLDGMRADLRELGTLRAGTAAAMLAAYGAHAAALVTTLRRRSLPAPLPRGPARVVGATAAVAGTALCLAGMRRFSGPGQVNGLTNQALVTGGVYRYSRNPQYLGYVLAAAGAALARRDAGGLALAALLAAAYAAWVPMEEEHLVRTLGEPYRAYLRRTSRWLAPPG